MDTLRALLSNDGFMPHGHCFLWTPSILWTTVISDGLIAFAYLTIPVTLIYLIRRRRDIPFDWVFFSFGVFILACGATHVLDIWTVWHPDYWLSTSLKVITAVASLITAVALVKLIPAALLIPSPSQLEKVNADLQAVNAELREAMSRAEVANRAKSAFLAAMSHELRTPMNAILGYGQILRRDKTLSPAQLLGVSTIQQSGQHLLALINDVLDLSKVEAGKLELNARPVRLADFLAVIADIIRVRAEKKNLRFELELAPELPVAIHVDETRLRQVLLNLLGNAVKFTDRGKVKLRVTKRAGATGTVDSFQLRFEVIDEGIGVAGDKLTTIFLPFEQVGDKARRASGTGLGLAISRQLVHLMGGDLTVDSVLGQGSRFWFDISLAETQMPLATEEEAQIVVGYEGPRKTILVVDDVAANRALLLDLLGALDFQLSEAENGEVALHLAASSPPDLILLDMVMPVMDGVEATRCLRADAATADIPIVMVSASATVEDEECAIAVGANAFITKPVEERELLHEIASLLHLEWRTELLVREQPKNVGNEQNGPLTPPPPNAMVQLHQLALAGNLSELRRVAAQVVRMDECYRPFIDKLDRLAADFQSKAVLALVEAHIDTQLLNPNKI